MTKRMLIDASHPEETRVVVADGTRIEELDFESSAKRQLRGNVYLARVTRVEPSLQAAFVEYGGNRHGFLAFSEIHPDYYQIPYEDRMALLKAEEEEAIAEAELEEAEDDAAADRKKTKKDSDDDAEDEANDAVDESDEDSDDDEDSKDDDDAQEEQKVTASKRRRQSSRRRYKIQEVIKRGQILLIQVVKEERGNKGAAMTTYLSLAGRYCVFMPNTPRGGGISRKIANGSDRKRLKTIVADLKVPQGIGVIVRTAGAKRTKTEIKRDYDYLSRLWETIREKTLKSIAPSLIHEEGDLVKRSIRDLYDKDITEVLVQGDSAYKDAKTFIKMLMPSHAKNVKAYKEDIPLFLRYDIERQLESSLSSLVQLKSGGYLVIHPTEALVSIDVNSGRSTKERNVERTALKTNLEAADEVARQMRLRDLAGLIVIDFIDMDENKNNRSVQNRMKEALSRDRARVQAGRISQFGLMEISRQRRRRSLLDASTISCPHCAGVGRQRSTESSALRALRATTEIAVRGSTARIRLRVTPDVALYIINEKRAQLDDIQASYDMFVELYADDKLLKPEFEIDVLHTRQAKNGDPMAEIEAKNRKERQKQERDNAKSKSKKSSSHKDKDKDNTQSERPEASEDDDGQPRRRRRRGRRGGRRRRSENSDNADINTSEDTAVATATTAPETSETSDNKAETGTKKSAAKKGTRRKAPTRKKPSEAETSKADDKSANKEDAASKDEPSKESVKKTSSRSTTRRAAPKRKAAEVKGETSETKAPAKKAPAKTPSAKPSSSTSTSRRKAPTRKAAPEGKVTEEKTSTEKTATSKPAAKRTRKAPAKKVAAKSTTTKKAPAKKAATKKAPAKKAAAKKAPAKKPAPAKAKTPEKAASKTSSAAKTTRTRKAPTRKAVDIEKPETISVEVPPAADTSPKKKSWLKRLTGRSKK